MVLNIRRDLIGFFAGFNDVFFKLKEGGWIGKKKYSPERALARLRQFEVLTGEGKSIHLACKDAGITYPTYYRWRTG